MKKPLVWMAGLFSLGILLAGWIKIPLFWLYLVFGVFFSLAVFLNGKFAGMIFLTALVFLCGMIRLETYTVKPACHIDRFDYKDKETYSIRGWVNSCPESKDNRTMFLFRTQAIATQKTILPCCGDVLAVIEGEKKTGYGEELILEGTLQRPFGEYLRRQGIFRIARIKTPDFVKRTGKNNGWAVKKILFKFKSRIESGFEKRLTPICAGIIEAMTLGEKKNVPQPIYKDMIRSGTVHILVVSGSNVGVVGFIVVLGLKIFRLKRRVRFFCAVPLLLAYCFLAGASNPVVRATIMAIVFLFAYFVKRQTDIYNSCAASGLIILSFNPVQIRDIGFQLSFASVLAIAFFYHRLKDWFRLDQLKCLWLRFPAEGCLVSFSAWLGTAGLIAAYFRTISPITVLANLLIVPLAGLITLSGFSLLLAQSVSSYLALSFASVNEFLVSLLLNLNSLLLRVPHAYFYF